MKTLQAHRSGQDVCSSHLHDGCYGCDSYCVSVGCDNGDNDDDDVYDDGSSMDARSTEQPVTSSPARQNSRYNILS
jgi:hypothetical protein